MWGMCTEAYYGVLKSVSVVFSSWEGIMEIVFNPFFFFEFFA